MQGHTRRHHTEKRAPEREEKVVQKEYLPDWKEIFSDLFEKYTEAGATLKGFRLREGWTQVDLAERLGVDQANLSNMERGKRPIGKEMAKRLAKIFDTDYRLFI